MSENTGENWAVQTSVKHGPNLVALTNVRGPDAATIAQHWHELAAFKGQIEGAINTFVSAPTAEQAAIAALQTQFTVERVPDPVVQQAAILPHMVPTAAYPATMPVSGVVDVPLPGFPGAPAAPQPAYNGQTMTMAAPAPAMAAPAATGGYPQSWGDNIGSPMAPCAAIPGAVHHLRAGVKAETGKAWKGVFCSADTCKVQWMKG